MDMDTIGTLEIEQKISDNYFVIKYVADNRYFIIRILPFLIGEIDHETAQLLIEKELDPALLFDNQDSYDVSIFNTPGVFFQPILIMTNACNLACKYCYADEGSYGINECQTMSADVVEKVVDYVCENLKSKADSISATRIELPFVAFGGESLLNLTALYKLIDYSQIRCASLSSEINIEVKALVYINTNGILITEELLNNLLPYKDMIEFVVSFDGIYHDDNRIYKDGSGSMEDTIKGIRLLNDFKFEYYITCCLIPSELNRIDENIQFIRSVIGDRRINLSFIRGAVENVQQSIQYPGRLQQQYTKENIKDYTDRILTLIQSGYNLYVDKFVNRVKAGGFANKCAACLYEFCVTADGKAYPCHNFILDKYSLGNIMNVDQFDICKTSIYDKFLNRNMDSVGDCSDCCLKSVCVSSFDCASHSENDLGDFYKVDQLTCEAGKRIQLAVLYRYFIEGIHSYDGV